MINTSTSKNYVLVNNNFHIPDYNYLNVDFQKNVKESLIKAVKTKADLILFIGSFYLLSHARRAVREYFS
jgi:folylpolyglutamate synthase/dihydropteroate synthase